MTNEDESSKSGRQRVGSAKFVFAHVETNSRINLGSERIL